jgi:hypothetical protein
MTGPDRRTGPATPGSVLGPAIAGLMAASRSDLLARRLPDRLFRVPIASGKDIP